MEEHAARAVVMKKVKRNMTMTEAQCEGECEDVRGEYDFEGMSLFIDWSLGK